MFLHTYSTREWWPILLYFFFLGSNRARIVEVCIKGTENPDGLHIYGLPHGDATLKIWSRGSVRWVCGKASNQHEYDEFNVQRDRIGFLSCGELDSEGSGGENRLLQFCILWDRIRVRRRLGRLPGGWLPADGMLTIPLFVSWFVHAPRWLMSRTIALRYYSSSTSPFWNIE